MSDYSATVSPIRRWTAQAGSASTAQTSASTSSSGLNTTDFKQLLTTLIMGMTMSSLSSESSDTSGLSSLGSSSSSMDATSLMGGGISGLSGATDSASMGNSLSSLMLPLMLTLLEKLISAETAASAEVGAGQTITATAAGYGDDSPSGRPIEGEITQMAHNGHIALDFGAPVGTDVHATLNGKVVYAGWNDEGYGNLVIVENGPYRVYFAHLSEIPVTVGQEVKSGQVIGLSGNTGNSTGPHLHYEVRKDNQQIDPADFTLN